MESKIQNCTITVVVVNCRLCSFLALVLEKNNLYNHKSNGPIFDCIYGSFSKCFSSSCCHEHPEMDNRLYQQLSTGWTYRWQQLLEGVMDRRFMLKFSMLMLILLFFNKTTVWKLTHGGYWEYVHQSSFLCCSLLRSFSFSIDRRYQFLTLE